MYFVSKEWDDYCTHKVSPENEEILDPIHVSLLCVNDNILRLSLWTVQSCDLAVCRPFLKQLYYTSDQ